MKDITITSSRIKKELYIFLILFFIAFLMNVYAIIVYGGAWAELFTQLHFVLVLALIFYLLVVLTRTIATVFRFLVKTETEE